MSSGLRATLGYFFNQIVPLLTVIILQGPLYFFSGEDQSPFFCILFFSRNQKKVNNTNLAPEYLSHAGQGAFPDDGDA